MVCSHVAFSTAAICPLMGRAVAWMNVVGCSRSIRPDDATLNVSSQTSSKRPGLRHCTGPFCFLAHLAEGASHEDRYQFAPTPQPVGRRGDVPSRRCAPASGPVPTPRQDMARTLRRALNEMKHIP